MSWLIKKMLKDKQGKISLLKVAAVISLTLLLLAAMFYYLQAFNLKKLDEMKVFGLLIKFFVSSNKLKAEFFCQRDVTCVIKGDIALAGDLNNEFSYFRIRSYDV